MNGSRDRRAAAPKDAERARVDELLPQAVRFAASTPRQRTSSTTPMMTALAEACRLARARELQPERVIIMLKAVWKRLRDTRFATHDEAQEALDRAVSACIREYFTEHSDAPAFPTSRQQ